MRGIRIKSLLKGAMLAGLSCAGLSASPIFGTFNIAGTITVTPSTITWKFNTSPFPPDMAQIGPGATGSFTGLDGTNVNISDLNSATAPVGVSFPDQVFMSFIAAPSLPALDINFIYQGLYSSATCGGTPAVGQTCTPNPPTSPFTFLNNPPPAPNGPQATGTFVFSGETADHLSTWTGNFTSQFNVPFQTILAAFATGGSGSVTNTFSATITVTPGTTVPEPGPGALAACGLGLVLFSAGLRHRSRRC